MVRNPDVVIIGGGVMGCSAAYYLTRLGVSNVLLLERDTLASGSTGRSMAILRMHYSNAVTIRMALASRQVIANFEERVGAPGGFVKTGYFFLAGESQAEALRANVRLQQSLGVQTQALRPREASACLPTEFDLSDVAVLAYEPESGFADSSAVTVGFASAARAAGAEIRMGVEVAGIATSRGRATGVLTGDGMVPAGTVVLTAGPWSRGFLEAVGAPLPLSWVRHQVVRLHRPLDRAPCLPTVGDMPHGLSFRPDAGDVVLIGVREDPAELDAYNRGVDTIVARESIAALTKRVPALADAGWDGGWSGLFTVTPDWHPVIDRVPGIDGLVCGVGFSGHGFKLSPAVGRALAEIVVHGRSVAIDMTPLRFSRFDEGDTLASAYGPTVFA